MQEVYTNSHSAGFEGMTTQDVEPSFRSATVESGSSIAFGRFNTLADGTGKVIRNIESNSVSIVFSAALSASNIVSVSVDGFAIAPETYATSNELTLDAVATKIEGLNGGSIYTATVDAPNNTITITADKHITPVTSSVSAGTAVTTTIKYSSTDKIFSLSAHQHKMPNADGTVLYNSKDMVRAMRKGQMFMYCEGAWDAKIPVYVRVVDGVTDVQKRGRLMVNVGSDFKGVLNTDLKFSDKGTDGLALVEVNLP